MNQEARYIGYIYTDLHIKLVSGKELRSGTGISRDPVNWGTVYWGFTVRMTVRLGLSNFQRKPILASHAGGRGFDSHIRQY